MVKHGRHGSLASPLVLLPVGPGSCALGNQIPLFQSSAVPGDRRCALPQHCELVQKATGGNEQKYCSMAGGVCHLAPCLPVLTGLFLAVTLWGGVTYLL